MPRLFCPVLRILPDTLPLVQLNACAAAKHRPPAAVTVVHCAAWFASGSPPDCTTPRFRVDSYLRYTLPYLVWFLPVIFFCLERCRAPPYRTPARLPCRTRTAPPRCRRFVRLDAAVTAHFGYLRSCGRLVTPTPRTFACLPLLPPRLPAFACLVTLPVIP